MNLGPLRKPSETRFLPNLPRVQYGSTVSMLFLHSPLSTVRPQSSGLARQSVCVRRSPEVRVSRRVSRPNNLFVS
ncbi:unnamed protein product [Danaus chrysippus]|uniref:(African queen) hypothetical protein n=1 Tax=Danaus chrysippus TaxID=151541 RepID=A0A8J2QKF5_9NEOP|nr:unnamed protein product [Danaus chrysippus]